MNFFGLPVHPLVVHATVVLVPLAALAVILAAFSSRFRAWAGPLPFLLSLVALIMAPLSTASGEELEHQVGEPGFDHAELGETLIWVLLPLAVLAFVAWWTARKGNGSSLGRIAGILAALVALGAVADIGLIGHSGASSAWCGQNKSFTKCQSGEEGGD